VRSSRSLAGRAGLVAALSSALLVGCRGGRASFEQGSEPAGVAPSSTPAPPAGLSAPAFQAYEAARQSVGAGDSAGARDHFLEAVGAQPDFTEAWYNLGATTTRLAVAAAGAGQDQQALVLFREGVGQKRRARSLIDEGKWFVYTTTEQQEQVISDLQHALEDADAVLADEPSLLAALRLWAAARR